MSLAPALKTLVDRALAAVAVRQEFTPLPVLKEAAQRQASAKDAIGAIRGVPGGVAIIAEVKRATPDAGPLAAVADPAALAVQYQAGGAALVSVVTEAQGYNGRMEDFQAVRAGVDLPLLRKEYVLTPYQLHESRALGSDMVLLIAELLEPTVLESLLERTHSLGMTALVECHSRLQARSAIAAGACAIGVNARDRVSGRVDRSKMEQVIDVIPSGVTVIAESGVRGPRDVFEYARVGADAVLVGRALVVCDSPAQLVADMVAAGSHPALRPDRRSPFRAQ